MNSTKCKKKQINCFWYLHFACTIRESKKREKKQIENNKTKRCGHRKKKLIIHMIDVINKFVY